MKFIKRVFALPRQLLLLLLLVPMVSQAAKNDAPKSSKSSGAKGSKGVLIEESTAVEVDYADRVLSSFMSYYERGIDEKLYLQTDKNYYSSGDQIWFKGYLLNAITHAPLNFTNFIYVELIDSEGLLIARVKVERDANGFNGHIAMDPTIEPGDYTLRGYTKWMMNKDDGFFYSKNLKIVSAITEMESKSETQTRAEIKAAQKALAAAEAAAAEARKGLKYEVQFFPEGGALLASTPQTVAFKALAQDGISLNVSGTIYDSKGEAISEIASTYKGMGLFQMIATPGETYVAKMKSEAGIEMSFNLPAVETRGVALKVSKVGDKAYYQIQATDPTLIEGGYVVIHSRGHIITVREASMSPVAVSGSLLRSGISTFALVDANMQVLSERLVFKKPDAKPTLKFKCSAENFAKRDLASFRVTVLDENGDPAKGDFAVSVTDNSSITLDPAKDNMLSYLLLSSDIKGNIEDPGLYFEDDTPARVHHLDLLMRTQAWRRFDLGEVLTGRVPKPGVFYEDVAFISGSVKGFFGNEARRPRVAVMCSEVNYVDIFDLDESSRFKLVGLNMPDSAVYIVRAQGRNGGGSLTLNIDPETFPDVVPGIFTHKEKEAVPVAFVNQSKDKFFYEGGMQTIELESITVTTSQKENTAVGFTATQSTTRELLSYMSGMTIGEVIQNIVGMSISSDYEVYYRGDSEPVRFIVDGMDDDYMNLYTLMADDIEQLDFFSGAEAAVFSDSSGGVITITMREVDLTTRVTLPNIAYVSQLGYQRPVKFFQPGYESASIRASWPPDYRTTIYWDGRIKPDAYGNINFGFYTADKATTYTVTIEGITESGEVCQGSTTMQRTLAN